MPRDRFLQIWRYFHLADNSVAPARDTPGFEKLYRVREFLNIVSHNISTEYKLSRDISIDETMVPHKGRLSFKQYIKNKPTQWGIKLWVLSEARTGYVYRFQVYLGKENNNPERNLARRVVRDLTTTVEGNNHHLYMDNFYCDPHLFLERKDWYLLLWYCKAREKRISQRYCYLKSRRKTLTTRTLRVEGPWATHSYELVQ